MKNVAILIAGALLLFAGGVVGMKYDSEKNDGALGAPEVQVLSGAMTAASTTVQTTSTNIVATSTSRKYAVFVNEGANGVYLNFGNNALLGKGIYLAPGGGSYEILGENLFTGAVNAIASSSASNLTYIEVR